MQRTLAIIAIFVAWWCCACAALPPTPPSADNSAKGDRELQRGVYWYHQGCTRKALNHLRAAHEHYSIADQQLGVARSLISLANLYRQAGNPENALLFYDAAVSAARRGGDQTILAQALSNKAAMLIENEEITAAEALLDEAQLLSRKTGSSAAMLLNHKAVLSMKAGQYDAALALLGEAESIHVETPSAVMGTLRYTRGKVLMQIGDYDQAMVLFEQALEQDRQAGFARGMADDLMAQADIHQQMGRHEDALDCLERSLKIHALIGNRAIVVDHLDRLVVLAKETGSSAQVAVHFINQWLTGEAVDVACH